MISEATLSRFEIVSFEELVEINGGLDLKELAGATIGGAAAGAVVGAMAGGVGAGPGAVAGAISGAVTDLGVQSVNAVADYVSKRQKSGGREGSGRDGK